MGRIYPMGVSLLARSIKEKAIQVGFDLVGVCPAAPYPESGFLGRWLERGYAGEMGYMEREPAKRAWIKELAPWAKSIVSCGLNYNTERAYSTQLVDADRGWVSRYAWGDDYHDLLRDKLERVAEFIRSSAPGEAHTRLYVDTGPVLDRVYAKYSGIGWYGKNTCIINQDMGSWIFVGEILTDLELAYDSPPPDRCGTCTLCIDACPTGAILEPYVLDSRRCISYLTIELKGTIPKEHRESMGNNIFGCDICQDVCPWNREAKVTGEEAFMPREGLFNPALSSLSHLTGEEFSGLFGGSPVKRAKRRGLMRNIMVAMGNSGNPEFAEPVRGALRDEEPLVRAHAAWALWKIEGEGAMETLSRHLEREESPMVIEEIRDILGSRGFKGDSGGDSEGAGR